MPFDLLQRKRNHFVLWHAAITNPPPALVIGTFQAGNPPSFQLLNRFDLAPSAVSADLWEVAAAACGLVDNCVYHYWFEVTNANPKTPSPARILCTDPTASTVDWPRAYRKNRLNVTARTPKRSARLMTKHSRAASITPRAARAG